MTRRKTARPKTASLDRFFREVRNWRVADHYLTELIDTLEREDGWVFHPDGWVERPDLTPRFLYIPTPAECADPAFILPTRDTTPPGYSAPGAPEPSGGDGADAAGGLVRRDAAA